MSHASLLTKQLPTNSFNTFKVSGKKPLGKWVRTLFEVPNLEYKGRLSVLYSSPQTFVYLAALETRKLGESTPLPPSPSSSRDWLKNLRHRAAELQRRPPASFVLDLGVQRLRRHWLSSPSSSLSHLGNLRQKSLAVPPAQVAQPRLRRKGGRGGRPGPSGAISIGSAPDGPDPPPTQVPSLSLVASFPTLIPSTALQPTPHLLNQFLEAEGQKVAREEKGGKPRWPRYRTQNGGGQTRREKRGSAGYSHFGPRLRPLNSTWVSPPPGRPPSLKWEIA